MNTALMKTVETTARPSEGLLRACGAIGLSLRRVDRTPRDPRLRAAAAELDAVLRTGQIALLTGPSGCGKSSILRALMRRRRRGAIVSAGERGLADPSDTRSVLDVLGQPWPRAMGTLSRAGLADPLAIARRPAELSDGQRARLAVALAIARAESCGEQRVTVVIDEFASSLDRPTARLLCRALRRWIARNGRVRIVVASAHADVESWLKPDWLWRGV